VFSYGWANALVYKAFGEEVPQRGGPPGRGPGAPSTAANSNLDYDAMLAKAAREAGEWNSLTLRLPASTEVNITLDRGTGGQPQKQSTLVLDAASATLMRTETFDDQTPARQARSIIRRLHTGEVLGVAGQTLAGFASLAAILLVWTGLALAWRRLVQPIVLKRRRIQSA
jgi:uncharacterized iron-regulated membrane protein